MCVCKYVYTYMIYICIYIRIYTYVYIYTCIYIYTHVDVCTCICMLTHVVVLVCSYICMRVCVCACVCACVRVYIDVYTHININTFICMYIRIFTKIYVYKHIHVHICIRQDVRELQNLSKRFEVHLLFIYTHAAVEQLISSTHVTAELIIKIWRAFAIRINICSCRTANIYTHAAPIRMNICNCRTAIHRTHTAVGLIQKSWRALVVLGAPFPRLYPGCCIHVWHDSFMWVPWLIRMCDMTHLYVCHDSFTRVTSLIHTCAMTHPHVCHDSSTCARWLTHMCAMTHPHVWHGTDLAAFAWYCARIVLLCTHDTHYSSMGVCLQGTRCLNAGWCQLVSSMKSRKLIGGKQLLISCITGRKRM